MTARAGHRQRSGFTLIEMIVVLAILAIVAGLASVGIGRALAASRDRNTLVGIADALLNQRIEAMRQQKSITCELSLVADRLHLSANGRDRSWPSVGLMPVDFIRPAVELPGISRAGPTTTARPTLNLESPARLTAVFDSKGRTQERLWRLAAVGDAKTASTGTPAPERTIWAIRFDPVSGVPTLHRGEQETDIQQDAATPGSRSATTSENTRK